MNPKLEQELFDRDKTIIQQLTQHEINRVRLRQRMRIENKRRMGLTKDEWANGVDASVFDLKMNTDKIAQTVMKKLKFPEAEIIPIKQAPAPAQEEEDCVMVSSEEEEEAPVLVAKQAIGREPILVRTKQKPKPAVPKKRLDEIDRALAEIEKAERSRQLRKRPAKSKR
jgi:hypothetical protein